MAPKRVVGSVIGTAWLLLLAGGCGRQKNEGDSTRVFRANHRSQLIGGPAALAEVGDFVLENDEIRVAILQPGNSVGPGIFGGSLIDADLNRPQAKYAAGRGLDQFAELFPSMNLLIPNPPPGAVRPGPDWDGPPADPPPKACPAVWPTDEAGNPLPPEDFSVVCASGPGDDYLEAMGVLGLIIGEASFQTDYILRRGVRYVEIVTTVDAGSGSRDEIRPMCPFHRSEDLGHEPEGVLEAIVGTGDYSKGMLAGDFLLFGKRLAMFVPGLGFDEHDYVMQRFIRGEDVLNNPVYYEWVAGVGKKVSYAVVVDRRPARDPWGVCGDDTPRQAKLLLPVETGSFTFAFTHWWRCPSSVPGCQSGGRLFYRRYFVIGEGDVASLLDVAYDIWGQDTGRIEGELYERDTGEPVPHAKVFVLKDPLDPAWSEDFPHADTPACEALRQHRDVISFELLERCARAASITPRFPRGQLGVVNEVLADRGDDPYPNGLFSARLAPGSYYVVGYQKGRLPSDAQRVEIAAGKTVQVGIPMTPKGRVIFDIRSNEGKHLAAKITVIGDCYDAQGRDVCECFPVTDPACQGDGVLDSGKRYHEFGGKRYKMGIVKIVHSATGRGEFFLAPGRYRFVVSKGAEYTIDEQVLEVPDDGRAVVLRGLLQRVVDSTGWITGDFHVHGTNSFDAIPSYEERITSFLVEGLELLSSSDHDWLTDYGPKARRMGVQRWLKTQVGLELTTVEIGHFIGFPLSFDDTKPENGAVDWRGLKPRQIFTALRALGEYGPENTVVLVPHPRDSFFGYFDQFGLSPFDLSLRPGFLQGQNHILSDVENFDPSMDAIELVNGKRYDMLRTPTNEEIRKFDACVAFLRGERESLPPDITEEECRPGWSEDDASTYWVRRVLARSPEESAAYHYERDGQRECLSDPDCAEAGYENAYCNPHTGMCRTPTACTDDSQCEFGGCDTGRGVCYLDSECDPSQPDACGQALVCDPTAQRCVEPCRDNWDCNPATACCRDASCGCEAPACGPSAGVCVAASCDPANEWETAGGGGPRPCVEWQGVVEDWFRLLNHGVVYTGMGNSDTHELTKVEAGMPHNYVCSSTDDPAEIDPLEIAQSVKRHCVVVSYGPLVELWVNGQKIGSEVNAPAGQPVDVRIRVQSPAWFDIDRVEVYRNGVLFRIFEANEQGGRCEGPESSWPCRTVDAPGGLGTKVCACIPTQDGHNTDVVNLDVTFQDDPEEDSWYVAIAMGVGPKARTLSPIYTPVYYPNMSFGLIINAAFSNFDIGIDLSQYVKPVPPTPQAGPVIPYAITNPVWVDRDADTEHFHFDPPGGKPAWLLHAAETNRQPYPLSSKSAQFRTLTRLSSSHVRSLSMNKVRAFFLRGLNRGLRTATLQRLRVQALRRSGE